MYSHFSFDFGSLSEQALEGTFAFLNLPTADKLSSWILPR
jgi:hypothetical protein